MSPTTRKASIVQNQRFDGFDRRVKRVFDMSGDYSP
jgi:hypothetical protein